MKSSLSWYWCKGCAKWHSTYRDNPIHYAMYCAQQEPVEANFDGTKEELDRFIVARQIRDEDQQRLREEFEERVTRRLAEQCTMAEW